MIVGLHGKIGAGKNEAAKRLAILSSVPVVEVSFAAKLKQSAAVLLGCTVADLELWKNDQSKLVCAGGLYDALGFVPYENLSQTVRSFLQRYGTEAHRDVFGADFWLDAALPLLSHAGAHNPYNHALYVVTDARFPNEAERVRELGGIMVGLTGPVLDTGSHASEVPLECDRWIDNAIRDDGYTSLDAQLGVLLSDLFPAALAA